MIIKESGVLDYISKAVSAIAGGVKTGYEGLDKLAWYAAPTAAVLGTLGIIRTLRPEAVADNADKLLLQETLMSSLAKSKRRYEQVAKDKEAATSYNAVPRHDRFI